MKKLKFLGIGNVLNFTCIEYEVLTLSELGAFSNTKNSKFSKFIRKLKGNPLVFTENLGFLSEMV